MKLRLLILLTTALCGLCTAAAQPAPEKTTPREAIFTFGPGTTISADRELASLAEYAARQLPVFLHDFLPETSSENRSEEIN